MKYLKKYESNNDEFIGYQDHLISEILEKCDISSLIGEKIFDIIINKHSTEIAFYCESGNNYCMYHDQDCCESVRLYDIVGDLDDLLRNPILKASADTNSGLVDAGTFREYGRDNEPENVIYSNDSHTWTFYNIATIKGYVTLRWLGESNGYYAEGVSFAKIKRLIG